MNIHREGVTGGVVKDNVVRQNKVSYVVIRINKSIN